MERERLVLHAGQPDPLEVKVRAVCGALLGVVIAIGLWFTFGPLGAAMTSVLLIFCVVGCGIGAVKWGNPFWHKVVPWLQLFY